MDDGKSEKPGKEGGHVVLSRVCSRCLGRGDFVLAMIQKLLADLARLGTEALRFVPYPPCRH